MISKTFKFLSNNIKDVSKSHLLIHFNSLIKFLKVNYNYNTIFLKSRLNFTQLYSF